MKENRCLIDLRNVNPLVTNYSGTTRVQTYGVFYDNFYLFSQYRSLEIKTAIARQFHLSPPVGTTEHIRYNIFLNIS